MASHRHLHAVSSATAPPPIAGDDEPGAEARRARIRRADPRATEKLQARTRASLDGFSVADIETLAARIREQLGGHTRCAAQGTASEADAATAAALRTALAAHEEVLAWLTETDTYVYHGQLR
ncbi:hypothetical protein Psed_6803 (plasmid) [Pseudonocardia dioxanivorans CB1190]|uniref:Uncharacterized protein n=1 Tax=Pseudonocardia dioxanivorans (strain ATCC 55486 / DSM 44775 / JCM 13855 / CB1190) TaxID=675635 RepID=F2L6I0_PSEUX|nr:hypothetical protein [Pseudonocardia dioxanivorans]AEA28874.1 hypothetical protein Psed_6803 [Pseudonocardia dioxanivorans CB1190]